ncbi:MAG: hypothetical protein U5K69_04695 [Balneolaceae bacterium]|nr:hypothetical protein [Balneolaceae bacterium]
MDPVCITVILPEEKSHGRTKSFAQKMIFPAGIRMSGPKFGITKSANERNNPTGYPKKQKLSSLPALAATSGGDENRPIPITIPTKTAMALRLEKTCLGLPPSWVILFIEWDVLVN